MRLFEVCGRFHAGLTSNCVGGTTMIQLQLRLARAHLARSCVLLLCGTIALMSWSFAFGADQGTKSTRNATHERAERHAKMQALLVVDRQQRKLKSVAKGAPMTVVVDRAGDDLSAQYQVCSAALNDCTLRGALLMTNSFFSADEIHFDIPGAGPHLIEVQAASQQLPVISDALLIDGYTQPGSFPNSAPLGMNAVLQIELLVGGLRVDAPDVNIRGLVIRNVIEIDGAGIYVSNLGSGSVRGCYIGTDVTGTQLRGNVDGVWIDRALGNPGVFEVGSEGLSSRNLISGNLTTGVTANGDEWNIGNNLIGTNATGTSAVPNGVGVLALGFCGNPSGAFNNAVVRDSNIISGNFNDGVIVRSESINGGSCSNDSATGMYVANNIIGLDASGSNLLPNGGVGIRVESGGVSGIVSVLNNRMGTPIDMGGPRNSINGGSGYSENFDSVSSPGLPPGWVASNALSINNIVWTTQVLSLPDAPSSPNVAAVDDENVQSDKRLDTPPITVTPQDKVFGFKRMHVFEDDYDGMVLEISVNSASFVDVIAAGGTFVAGGYNATLGGVGRGSTNVLSGRPAWTGTQSTFVNSVYKLPASVVPGDTVIFRFRVGTDSSVGNPGVRIDNVFSGGVANLPLTPGIVVGGTGMPVERVLINGTTHYDGGSGSDPDNLVAPFVDLGNDGRTPNDAGDVDSGANGVINFPDLTAASVAAGDLTIDYSLTAPAGEYPMKIEFYEATNTGSPTRYLTSWLVSSATGAVGQIVVPSAQMAAGEFVTALNSSNASGNTSELGVPVQITGSGGGGTTCTWNPSGAGPNDWTNPSKWSLCSTGAGPGPGPVGTPGAIDTAIIATGTPNLDLPVSVAGLQMNGGTLSGDHTITVTESFEWNGGSLTASSAITALVVDSAATAALAGGQKNLIGRSLTLANSTTRWESGLIEMGNGAAMDISSATVFEIEPGALEESIYFNNVGATPTINNAGTISKLGAGTAGINRNITLTQSGTIRAEGGVFRVRANGNGTGSFIAESGATLDFSAGTFNFLIGATLTGNGSVNFGNTGTVAGSYASADCFIFNGSVSIRNATLSINCSGMQNFRQLSLQHPGAILQGSANFTVLSQMLWSQGAIVGNGAPAATIALDIGATATWTNGLNGTARVLNARDFLNAGTVRVSSQLTPMQLTNNARVVNSAIFELDQSDGVSLWLTSGTGTPSFVNNGALSVINGSWRVDPVFVNDGNVTIATTAALDLHGAGTDLGGYSVDSAGFLRFKGAGLIRTLSGSSGISGQGSFEVSFGARANIDASTYTIATTVVGGQANTTLDLSTGGTVTIENLRLTGAGTITGTSPITVTDSWNHNGGVVTTTAAIGAPEFRFGVGSLATPADKIYRKRSVVIDGATNWGGGDLIFGGDAQLSIAGTGALIASTSTGPIDVRCEVGCSSTITNDGIWRKLTPGTLTVAADLAVLNAGELTVMGGTLSLLDGYAQSAGSTQLSAGTTLNLGSNSALIEGGLVSGSGTLSGDLNLVSGSVEPGSSPGIFSVSGNYTQGSGGTLIIQVAGITPGTQHDQLSIGGSADIDGTLVVADFGHTLVPPEEIVFLTASTGSVTGSFASVNSDYSGYGVVNRGTSMALIPQGNALVVNTVSDSGDGVCDLSDCTLREAIVASNLLDGSVIEFNIPPGQCTGSGGACVIQPLTPLPTIFAQVHINAYTQPGAVANTHPQNLGLGTNASIKIELDGSLQVGGNGLRVEASSAVRIEGFAIHHFPIGIALGAVTTVKIGGNWLGLHADGTAAGGQNYGVLVHWLGNPSPSNVRAPSGSGIVIGSANGDPAGMNVISGQTASGIWLREAQVGTFVTIQGNLIGTAPDGVSAMANGEHGIRGETDGGVPFTVIGGSDPDLANVIGFNGEDGIYLNCEIGISQCFDQMQIIGNRIGVTMLGADAGNAASGINAFDLASGRVNIGGTLEQEANSIRFNGQHGVVLNGPQPRGVGQVALAVLRNHIDSNDGLAVDLGDDGRTPNDSGDGDGGPNRQQNFPDFTLYTLNPNGMEAALGYTIDTPNVGGNYPMRVDFYQSKLDELGEWLGTETCSGLPPRADCTANLSFPAGVVLTPGDSIVAIVTDDRGRSSEVSYYATTTQIVSHDPNPSEIGAPYTVVVEVSSDLFLPLEPVDIDDGQGSSCIALLSPVDGNTATGSCQLTTSVSGPTTITAHFSANRETALEESMATAPHSVNVGALPTTTSIVSITPTSTVVGQPYTVTVSVLRAGSPVIPGSVTVRQISDGATCTFALTTANSCQLVSNSAITTAVRATYSGSVGLDASQSALTSHLVNRADTSITILTDTPDPSDVNEPVLVTMRLDVLPPGAGMPGGSILVTDGTASCGTDLPNLSCSLIPKALGAATLEARYQGDANFNASTDTEAHTITVNGADLAILKRNGLRLLPGGAPASYVILVSNNGPQSVINARVSDILPTQLSNASWTCIASANASCPASGVGTIDTLVSLNAGATVTFTLTATVQLSPEQIVTNRATVTAPQNAPDPNLVNNESSDTDLIGVFGDGFEAENE